MFSSLVDSVMALFRVDYSGKSSNRPQKVYVEKISVVIQLFSHVTVLEAKVLNKLV